MNCFYCKSNDIVSSFTTHVVDLGKCVIIVKNVPCHECEKCGAKFYDDDVAEQLERIVKLSANALTEIAVVNYSGSVA